MRFTPTARAVAVLCTFLTVAAVPAIASIGVGIGSGKIVVQQELKPGGIYDLPELPVLNTGDEPSDYGVSIEFNEIQPQFKPAREWFSFEPATFHLEPQQSRLVKTSLSVPLKAPPGAYFAYLEAHPAHKAQAGQTGVGVAAASKLYFTVAPANIFMGLYYRAMISFVRYGPWTYIVAGAGVLMALISVFRRFVSLNVGIRLK